MNDEGKIMTVGIVGTGLMGAGIAQVSAQGGFRTVLVKATPGDPSFARARIEKSMGKLVAKGKLSSEAADEAKARLTVTGDIAELSDADVVIEAIVEDLALKRALFARLEEVARPGAIFASNTSTLRIADLAEGSARAGRFIGLHFFSPVPRMKLVELAHLPSTEPDVVAKATELVAALGKTAVPVLDSTGFIVNRVLVPLLVGAIAAFQQGLARAEHIDTAMRLGCNHPMGPLALCDLIGLDIVHAMAKLLHEDLRDARYRPPALLEHLVKQGHLGKKTGRGLYDYSTDTPGTDPQVWDLVKAGSFEPAGDVEAA